MTLRKSLVVAATALTVSAAGVGVASAEEPIADTNQIILAADGDNNTEGSSFGSLSSNDDDENGDPSEGGSSDIDVDNVASWIGVFTAVIGAASALAGFISKFMA